MYVHCSGKWYPKSVGASLGAAGVEPAANVPWLNPVDSSYEFEELERAFTPEEMCLQECANAGAYSLGEAGIFESLELVKCQQWLVGLTDLRQAREDCILQLMGEAAQRGAVHIERTAAVRNLETLVQHMIRY